MCASGEDVTVPPVTAIVHSTLLTSCSCVHLVLMAFQEWGASHMLGTERGMLSCGYLFIFRHLLPSSQEVAVEFVSKYRQGWPQAICRHPFWPLEGHTLGELTARGQLQAHTWNCW